MPQTAPMPSLVLMVLMTMSLIYTNSMLFFNKDNTMKKEMKFLTKSNNKPLKW